MFNSFAEIYDELMDKSLYPKWLKFTERFAPLGTKKVLDLACGTGDFSILLARNNFKVMGLDSSEEMLSIASSKLDENDVMFVKRDMRNLDGVGIFDLITCFDDSLNYLLDFSDINKVFSGVYNSLKSGGVFLFDVVSLYQVDVIYEDFRYNYSDHDNSLLWNAYQGEKDHSVIHDLVIFKYDSEIDAYHRYSEQQEERAYEMWQFLDSLKNVGFNEIQTWADFGQKEIDPKTKRWFFVARKD
ncbi:class I SAM-dependent DNA methyltransferase [Xylocopilactobacillus apis]|uniref:Methyltransferase n=1 Tax=Xylocopilactobacillus apis TaxID=2932183 RepID=A0AAU9CXV8_9LACO|nr:class I SAM-dependent methyltransferase [Xylocopilactobacillus apis]BDR56229.1 methyltransferase [Xylocopilactobacillus apis]